MIQKAVLGVVIGSLLGLQAQAQTSDANTQTVNTSAVQPVQTIETTAAPAETSALSLKLTSESSIDQSAIEEHSSEAPMNSLNALGIAYKFQDKSSLGLYQHAQFVSNRDKLTAAAQVDQKDAWESSYTMLRYTKPTQIKIGGSELTFETRYYAPNSRAMERTKANGLLRTEAYTEWMVSPKVGITGYVSPRFTLNSQDNPSKTADGVWIGSDAQYRMVLFSCASYYFNDSFNAYYGYTLDMRSRDAQRGIIAADTANEGTHEIGANITAGSFAINPTVSSLVNHNLPSGSVFTADTRAMSHETLAYNLNISASF